MLKLKVFKRRRSNQTKPPEEEKTVFYCKNGHVVIVMQANANWPGCMASSCSAPAVGMFSGTLSQVDKSMRVVDCMGIDEDSYLKFDVESIPPEYRVEISSSPIHKQPAA